MSRPRVMRDIHDCKFCEMEIMKDSRKRYCSKECKYQYTRKVHAEAKYCGICERPERLMKRGIPMNLVKDEWCNECWRCIQAAKLLLDHQKYMDEFWANAEEMRKVAK